MGQLEISGSLEAPVAKEAEGSRWIGAGQMRIHMTGRGMRNDAS